MSEVTANVRSFVLASPRAVGSPGNVFCFWVNAAGTTSVAMGTEGSTLGAVKFPDFPVGSAHIGFVIINPTGAGPFVGGTTALGDVTVVPNAVYISPLGSFDPSILFS